MRGDIKISRYGFSLTCFALMLFTACASMTTVKIKPTDIVRNTSVTEKSATIQVHERQWPSSINPNMEIVVLLLVTEEETFQRRYIEKKVLRPGIRIALLLSGAAALGLGNSAYQQGLVVLGRDLMGLGLLIPAVGGVLGRSEEVGEQWQPENRNLPRRATPAANTPIIASTGSVSWIIQTDDNSRVTLDISSLADLVEPGHPLIIDLALQEDSTRKGTFSIPTPLVAFYQSLPPEELAPVAERLSIPSGEVENVPTLAILDFEGLGISEQEAQVLTNRLGTHMVQLGRYQVIERGQMQQILTEQDFQMTGCTSDECAVEIGQLLGVRQMLAGSFGKFGSIYTIDMRIIDVATGGILRTTSYDVQGEAERLLTEGLAEAARRIAGVD